MWVSTSIKLPNVPKWLLNSSVMQTVAGAQQQQQFYQFAKIQSACLFPLKMPSLKNPDPGNFCKKWGVRVRHVDLPPVLAKKKRFFATTRVVPFFGGNSKGDWTLWILDDSSRLFLSFGARRQGRVFVQTLFRQVLERSVETNHDQLFFKHYPLVN